jgi:predicted metal-binding protein
MGVDSKRLVGDAVALGADRAAIAEVAAIKFVEEYRQACEKNTCRKYNTNWVCPPAVGTFEELKARACRYERGLLFQTVRQLDGSFDWPGMMAAKKDHDGVFRKIVAAVREEHGLKDILALCAGACEVCPRCAYLDNQPCRLPDEAFASLEAYGIDVLQLEKACGLPYYSGKDTVTYVGLILF